MVRGCKVQRATPPLPHQREVLTRFGLDTWHDQARSGTAVAPGFDQKPAVDGPVTVGAHLQPNVLRTTRVEVVRGERYELALQPSSAGRVGQRSAESDEDSHIPRLFTIQEQWPGRISVSQGSHCGQPQSRH